MSEAVGQAASALGSVFSFKGNMNAARNAKAVGDYNARVAENEAVLLRRAKVEQEANLRQSAERVVSAQRVATAKSGIQMSGSPFLALADTYFGTEMDALRIQYAGDIEEAGKISEAAMARATGRARRDALKTKAYVTLLEAGVKAASGGFIT